MKLKTKKIIAKEFLILTLVTVLGLIAFLCTYPYNAYRQHQIDNFSNTITEKTKLADSLYRSSIVVMDKDYLKEFFNTYVLPKKADAIYDDWLSKIATNETYKKGMFETYVLPDKADATYEDWHKKVFGTTPTSQINPKLKFEVKTLSNSREYHIKQILSYNEQIDFGIKSIIFFTILLFGLRYLLYCVSWSIKTLKKKSE